MPKIAVKKRKTPLNASKMPQKYVNPAKIYFFLNVFRFLATVDRHPRFLSRKLPPWIRRPTRDIHGTQISLRDTNEENLHRPP